ncbi:vasoactive intestinal polypeptide receptor 1 isoform X2 [Microplitis demolitor]|uniref:vasoactive intestinal polypeptide receptor 1 isoform X2 n=1 Tax=Microplitis demolitor TaxID=69319 RepID=UPI00235B6DCD|nr:vasoactive intestinal polypeptide receptor 1 isoform X2 [Microplitis demolitor]
MYLKQSSLLIFVDFEKLLSIISKNIKANITNQCSPFFDGLLCWPPSDSNQTINLPCPPHFVLGYKSPRASAVATKYCTVNNEWYRNNDGVFWSNYTECTPPPGHFITAVKNLEFTHSEYGKFCNSTILEKWLPIIKTISKIGYASSLITLLVAMIIFLFIRKLRNSRNRLHMNLFLSFIMRASMALLKDWLFVDGVGLSWDVVSVDGKSTFIKEKNNWMCKAITSLWQYSIVANYTWIFIEGLYLHNLIFFSFTDTSTIIYYIIFGWILPATVVTVWIILRIIEEDTLCWTTHNNPSFFLVIRIPIIVSIMFNFVLFINIVRVLLVKMRTSVYLQRKKMRYGKWAKSTLILVPLFGAHYAIFLGLSYHKDYQLELIWLFWDQFFASFQGSVIALLYCFLNGEVRAEVKKAWRIRRSRRGADSLSFSNRYLIKSPELRNQHRFNHNKNNNVSIL